MPLAAARAGLVHVPINPVLKHAQAAHILADSGARAADRQPGAAGKPGSKAIWPRPRRSRSRIGATATRRCRRRRTIPNELAALLYTSRLDRPAQGGDAEPRQPLARRDQRGALPRPQARRPDAGRAAAGVRLWPEPAALGLGGWRLRRSASTISCRATWSARSDVMTSPCWPAFRRCGCSSPSRIGARRATACAP